ncbi:hypothetical protein HQ489_01725 [Candidatus Woesearchaeota archaeon]|nr:hypothetical protein [Candidatus Woesearchaeota archaeon]
MKKRGLMLVVLLVLSIFYSAMVLGETNKTDVKLEKYTEYKAIAIKNNCDDKEECEKKETHVNKYCAESSSESCGFGDECDDVEIGWPDSGQSCIIYSYELDGGGDDECVSATVLTGLNVNEQYTSLGEKKDILSTDFDDFVDGGTSSAVLAGAGAGAGIGSVFPVIGTLIGAAVGAVVGLVTSIALNIFGGNADAKTALQYAPFNFKDQNGVLCGSNKKWVQCDEGHKDALYWVNFEIPIELDDGTQLKKTIPTLLYECKDLGNNEGFTWQIKEDRDNDKDGWTKAQGDCSDYGYLDPYLGCPVLSEEDYQGQTKEFIRGKVKDLCGDPEFSFCSMCTNPGANEICGDKINNDCKAPSGVIDVFNFLEGETNDDCNLNQDACRQDKNQNNFVNEKLSYESGSKGSSTGFCCGAGGLDDVGKSWSNDDGGFVCINNDPTLIGGVKLSDQLCPSGENWCLISATQNPFKVFTINKPGEEAYDIVSNSEGWYQCKDNVQNLEAPSLNVENQKFSNRFQCYKEGDRWSWAECFGEGSPKKNDNVKGRYTGQSLYTLPLIKGKENEQGQNILKGDGVTIDVQSNFKDWYGADTTLDFEGYDSLEFFVKYENPDNLKLPAGLTLEIFGPQNKKYYSSGVLGFAQNGFFSENSSMHIKVPIQPYKGVKTISLKTLNQQNAFELQGMFLSKGETQFCSGIDDREQSNWLENLDQGDAETFFATSESLCKSLYGDNAWLGNDESVDIETANCCGNVANEYYDGASATETGCWNSQPLGIGDTSMDIKFTVSSAEKQFDVKFPEKSVSFTYTTHTGNYYLTGEGTAGKIDPESLGKDSSAIYCLEKDYGGDCVKWKEETVTSDPITKTISFKGESQKVEEITINKAEHRLTYMGDFYGEITINSEDEDVVLSFYAPLQGDSWDKILPVNELRSLFENKVYIMADYKTIEANELTPIQKTQELIYSCTKDECLFPLPGEAPYTVTNPHPELYELYFVTGSDKASEHFIGTERTFDKKANLKVKKVAQQIIYDGEFFGCSAVDYLIGEGKLKEENNLKHCAVKGDAFCAYSVSEGDNKEVLSTINSWSKVDETKVGYDNTDSFNFNNPEDSFLTLKEANYKANERNSSSGAVPARNILSNALFIPSGSELPHWEILAQGSLKKNEQLNLEGTKVNLDAGETLRSERIAVVPGTLHFVHNGTCEASLNIIDKDGKSSDATLPEFKIEQTSYLALSFEGPCSVEKPMLQYRDDEAPAEFYFQDLYPARAGAACCAENGCWNGFACVEEMSSLSNFYEPTGDNRNYRCVEGDWVNVPANKDWIEDKAGFCQSKSQCFVLSEDDGGTAANSAASFIDGLYPNCIDSGEYILDNYCNEGVWTSRTKFIAESLLDVAGSNDYSLYCTNYQDTLLHLDGKENQIAGTNLETVKKELGLGEAIGGGPAEEIIRSCFSDIKGEEAGRLLNKGENSCINNVCILKQGDKTIMGTTLNHPLDDPEKSFLIALDIPPQKLNEICQTGEGFVLCDLSKVNQEGDLWYNKNLNAIIYSKDGVNLKKSGLVSFFSKLFGADDKVNPFAEFKSFRDIYSLNINNKEIVGIKQLRASNSSAIV